MPTHSFLSIIFILVSKNSFKPKTKFADIAWKKNVIYGATFTII